MANLTIFGNFFIHTKENLLRMKDSFLSFKDISATNWVINIRGQFRYEAMTYLKYFLGKRLTAFTLTGDAGWFHDSRIMMESIKSSHVFFWIEDHINLVSDMSIYDQIINELSLSKSDFMYYSFYWTRKRYEHIEKTKMQRISWFDLNIDTFHKVTAKHPGTYIIGAVGIFTFDLFSRIILSEDPQQAIKWPPHTPFDFEKSSYDTHWLPIRMAVPELELFASIDDDSIVPGSCLISRGLYPEREKRQTMGASHIQPIRHP